jgi:hypothetical protein
MGFYPISKDVQPAQGCTDQTMLFSATLGTKVGNLAGLYE